MTDHTTAHDLGTSAGGRAYIAEYFATQLRRHDFARYIQNTLAADFACAMAQHLSKLRAPVADERAAQRRAVGNQYHVLKTDPEVFQAVLDGAKTFEVRMNDRGYSVGDALGLRETKHTGAEMRAGAPLVYTGRECQRFVSHVLTGYGLADGWCCLSFDLPHAAQASAPVAALQWSEVTEPNEQNRYTHVLAESPLGQFSIEWKSWKRHDSYCIYLNGDYLDTAMNLDDAKAIALKKVADMAHALAGYAVSVASAPVAGEAQSTDEQIFDIADRVWREQEQDPTDKSAVLALVREVLGKAPVAGEAKRIFLVPTGEVYCGQETYTRHEDQPPVNTDHECLYAAPQARPTDDDLWDQTLKERDHYHDMADQLANAIGAYFGEGVGEHSSAHCPWHEALGIIDDAAPQASEAVPGCLLAADHVGMTVDYTGLLGQARSALKQGENAPAMAEMLRQLAVHLTELGQRWYAGDGAVVDEFLQLYCVESDTRAALSAQPRTQKEQSDA